MKRGKTQYWIRGSHSYIVLPRLTALYLVISGFGGSVESKLPNHARLGLRFAAAPTYIV